MNDSLEKFQRLLRELFQFDCADLDFGIYRIMNHKRGVIKGSLTRELDFYLKNEVLNLDEIEAAGEAHAEAWFQLMRVIKAIGGRIVEFLAQIEDFQEMLWEKRQFVTETQYCITVGNIDERFYPKIAENEAQWDEWKELGCVGITAGNGAVPGIAAVPAAQCGPEARDPRNERCLVYRGTVDHKEVVVLWRETEGWEKEDFERDKKFVAEQNLPEGADEVFVNGDSFIPGAQALDGVFKARLFAPVEA